MNELNTDTNNLPQDAADMAAEPRVAENPAQQNGPPSGKLSPALKKELMHIIIYVSIGLVILFGVMFLLMAIFPEMKESPDFAYWKILLGGFGGGGVAVFNFFLMGLTVQKVASDTNQDRARNRMKLSYTYRYLMQIAWIVIAILVPCFNYVAGIVPLLFPSLGIKIASIIFKKN